MKLAIICGGKKQLQNEPPLKYIGDSVKRVIKTLKVNDWKCIPFEEATTTKKLKELLSEHKDKVIDECIFYYIGHGYGNNIDTFQIYFKEHPLNIEQIMKDTIRDALGRYPKKIALILDACYSGRAIDNKSLVKDVEMLTASSRDDVAFEKIMPDGNGWSEFSYYFCNIFETEQESDYLNLEQIGKYIAGDNQTGKDTFYLRDPSSLADKMIIGSSKDINNIKDVLKNYFSNTSIETYKEHIFEYLKNQSTNFNALFNATTFNEISSILLREEKCLYCLLKKQGDNSTIIKTVDSDFDCKALAKKVEDSRHITRIILKIELESNNLSKGKISGWKRNNSNKYISLGLSRNSIDFSQNAKENSYLEILPQYVLDAFGGKKPKSQIELQLILPYKLFSINFDALILDTKIVQTWNQAFNISKRFLANYDNYYIEDEVLDWKNNSDKYRNLQNETLDTLALLKIDTIEKKDNIDLFNNEGSNYILLASNYSLNDEKELMKICYYGIPHTISPQLKAYAITESIDFAYEKEVVDMYACIFAFMRENRLNCDTQFICDDYNDVAFMNSDKSELENTEEL